MIKIKLGEREYNVQEARSIDEKEKGLQNIKELPQDEGMIFYFDQPELVEMWMRDTLIPLDIIFINEDQEVIAVEQLIQVFKKEIHQNLLMMTIAKLL